MVIVQGNEVLIAERTTSGSGMFLTVLDHTTKKCECICINKADARQLRDVITEWLDGK